MQTVDEQVELGRQIVATAEVIGHVISHTAASLMTEDLAHYPFLPCCAALKRCRAEVRGKLTLSDVVTRIAGADGRPEANEAWALALQSLDERDSLVWTSEIQCALEAAKPILAVKDKVGARMAFLSAYERLVASARDAATPAHWVVSMGWDGDLRNRALEQAVKLQRLPMDRALQLGYEAPLQLTGPEQATVKAIAGLITGSQPESAPPPDVREKLDALKQSIKSSAEAREAERRARIERERQELQARKQHAADAVAERQSGQQA